MVEVKYYETVTARKNEEVLGVFNINITPKEIPPIDEALKGEEAEKALIKRSIAVEQAKKDCEFAALDKVREIVGRDGVLVAKIIEKEG